MKKTIQLLLATVFIFSFTTAFGQLSSDKVKAVFVCNFVKGIEWENQDTITSYNIGVLSNRAVYNEVDKLSGEQQLLGKPVKAFHFSRIKDIENIHVLYVDPSRNTDIDDIIAKTKGTKTLVITDQLPVFNKIMINFLPMNQRKRYELNKKNIEDEGLKVLASIVVYGGQLNDVREIYFSSKKELQAQQEELEKIQLELKSRIEQHKKDIEKAKQELIERTNQLEQQKFEIEQKTAQLSELNLGIAEQQAALDEKVRVLAEQELGIKKQEQKIKEQENRILLNDQTIAEKEKQRAMLQKTVVNQNITLVEQKDEINVKQKSLYITFGIISIFIVLIIMIFRSYREKNRINLELEHKNDAINKQNIEIEKAYNNIQVLSEFGQKITATLDIESINSMIFEYVSHLMDTSAFGIGVYKKDRDLIQFKRFMENGKALEPFAVRMSSSNSLSVWTLNNKLPVRLADFESDFKEYIPEKPYQLTSQPPCSAMYLPLFVENKPTGVIAVQSYTKNAYTENNFNALQTLGSYVAIALDNANAYEIVRQQNENIKGSIRYAQTIQNAILPIKEVMSSRFDHFVIFRPKDIVSGDFYWYTRVEIQSNGATLPLDFFAVVDCTGHGVPGAFMSMIGNRLLNEIVNERKVYSPAEILEEVHQGVRRALKQDKTDNNDGMDMCLVRMEPLDQEKTIVTFSGAKRPLFYHRHQSSDVIRIKGSRKSIGGVKSKNDFIFEEDEILLFKNDTIYLTTDGLIDQNSFDRKRFGTKMFIEILKNNMGSSLIDQQTILTKALDEHQVESEQRDDITVMGIRL